MIMMAKSLRRSVRPQFSISEALSFGWKIMKSNFLLLLMLIGIHFVLAVGEEFIHEVIQPQDFLTQFMLHIGRFVIQALFMLGTYNIMLKIVEKKKAKIRDLFSVSYLLPQYIIAIIIKVLVILVGFLLFIIPGVFWSVRFQFSSYIIIDEKVSPFEAIRRSSQITKGNWWKLFFFNIVLVLINIAGAICFLIGLIVTIPTTMLASAYVYRKLSRK